MTARGKPASPELIDAIRRHAVAKMSASQIANELSTQAHPLSRNAIAGIAHREGIKLNGKNVGNKYSHPPRARNPRHAVRKPRSAPAPHVVAAKSDWLVRPPRASCSWAGCTSEVQLGDMFCFSHGRKGLFA